MAHLIGPQASWLGRNNDSALVMATSRLPKRRPWSPAAGRIRKYLRGPRFSGYRRTWCGDESDHWTNATLPAPSRVLTATWNSTGPCGFFCVCCRLVIFTKDHEYGTLLCPIAEESQNRGSKNGKDGYTEITSARPANKEISRFDGDGLILRIALQAKGRKKNECFRYALPLSKRRTKKRVNAQYWQFSIHQVLSGKATP